MGRVGHAIQGESEDEDQYKVKHYELKKVVWLACHFDNEMNTHLMASVPGWI